MKPPVTYIFESDITFLDHQQARRLIAKSANPADIKLGNYYLIDEMAAHAAYVAAVKRRQSLSDRILENLNEDELGEVLTGLPQTKPTETTEPTEVTHG